MNIKAKDLVFIFSLVFLVLLFFKFVKYYIKKFHDVCL
jgi:flagellar biogenesis protein FliO